MFNSKVRSECVACLIRPVLSLSFGIFSIVKPLCSHIDPKVLEPMLVYDYLAITISLLYTTIMASGLGLYFWNISESRNVNRMEDKLNMVFEIGSCNIIYFTFNFYFLVKRYRKYTEALFLLVFRRRDFGIESLLGEHDIKKLQNFIRFYKYCFLLQCSLKMTIALKEIASFRVFLDRVGTALSYASAYYLVAQILLLFMTYNIIVRSFQKCVRHTLGNPEGQILVEKIRLFRLFYVSLCSNYKKHIFCFGNLFYYIVLFLTSISIGVVGYGAMADLLTTFTMDYILITVDSCLSITWFWYTFLLFCGYTEELTQSVSLESVLM